MNPYPNQQPPYGGGQHPNQQPPYSPQPPYGQPPVPYPTQFAGQHVPVTPAPARSGFGRPRAWHIAGAVTILLFMFWALAAMAACTGTADWDTYAATGDINSCSREGGGASAFLPLLGIVVTGVLGWRRHKTYTHFRKAVFAVDDYSRRVPPGTEGYVDLGTHQMAAAAAATASSEMFLNMGYWFAPSGPATQARIDQIRETGARAQVAAQQIQMRQYAPVDDEPAEDLDAPDLGRGDNADTPNDADDWMSGVDNNDNDW